MHTIALWFASLLVFFSSALGLSQPAIEAHPTPFRAVAERRDAYVPPEQLSSYEIALRHEREHPYKEEELEGGGGNYMIAGFYPDYYVLYRVVQSGERIDGADISTFTALSPSTAKDARNLYMEEKIVPQPSGLDLSTFVAVGGDYYKDANRVYHWAYYGDSLVQPLEGVDPQTFGVLMQQCSHGRNFFAKDAHNVYCGRTIVPGADASTFEYVGYYEIQFEGGGMPSGLFVARDKNCIYHGVKKVVDAQGVCISPGQCTKDSLASSPILCGF